MTTLEDRQQERALQKRGLVRVDTYVANLALRAGVPVEKGPPIHGSNLDRGLWVPAWVQWHLERFPDQGDNLRARQESLEALKDDKNAQLLLLLEANLCGATLYDPTGDLGTAAALELLQKEVG